MAHFAKIENNKVVEIIVVENEDLNNLEFPESEKVGQEFIKNIGLEGNFKQTSYNNSFRYYYAGMEYVFDSNFGEYGAFIPPKPFPSWNLDENIVWQPPIKQPNDGAEYFWNEDNKGWEKI